MPYTGAGPTVELDTRPGDDYQRIDATPDMFGGAIGRGMEQLGQGLQQAQKFHGEVAANDATNAYQDQATKLLWGDPNKQVRQPDGTVAPDTGFFGLRGDAALRARPDVEAQLDALQRNGSAGLPSAESRLQFDSYTRRLRSNLGERIGQHADQQAGVWRTGVNDSTADLARQSIANNPEDPEAVKHGFADLLRARESEAAASSGGDPTMVTAANRRAYGEGVVTRVEALLNRNPSMAKQVLEGDRASLPPDTYDKLVNRLRPMLSGDQADQAIRLAAGGRAVEGADVAHTAPAGGGSAISDSDALAAEKRLAAGTGTDADRALHARYVQQQNTPAGQQPPAAASPATPNGLPQEGPVPPARGDGGPVPAPQPGAPAQPGGVQPGIPAATQPPAALAATPVTSARHADFVSGQQLKAAEAAAQIRDRKPVLSDADKAADAADQQLLDRYKASHGIPRTSPVNIETLPDDPPQAMRDVSPEPVPHPDTHVIPPHPHASAAPALAPWAGAARTLPIATPGAPATPFFAQVGAPYGISGNYLARTKMIESGSGSGANAVSSSGATGPFQFTAGTAKRYGLTDPRDLAASADAAARLAADNRAALTRSLGRAPSDAELYLAHQQGSGGAAKLLANPNARAGDLVGDSAIRSNGGDPNAPASAFVSLWTNKFNGTKGALPMFATGFGTGQPYLGGPPPAGLVPPLPSPVPTTVPSITAPPPATLMEQASAAPPSVSPPPAAPTLGQPPAAAAGAGAGANQPAAAPMAVPYNPDDPSSPLPDRSMALAHARALAGGDPIQARMNIAEVNRRYNEQNAILATDRAELAQRLPDLQAAASAGVDGITLPEGEVRRLFPPAKAEQIIGDFHANQAVGSLMRGVQWASPDQLGEMQRSLSSGLGVYSDSLRAHRGRASTGAGTTGAEEDGADLGFFRRRELASKQIAAEINHRAGLLVGPEADPAAYVAANPTVRQAWAASQAGQGGTAAYEHYASTALGLQGFLGVPEAQRHLMTRGGAQQLATFVASSSDPKAALQQLAASAGSAWPQQFRDMTTIGGLPAGFQAVQMLEDAHDAALLGRALASERPGPDGKPAKSIDDTTDLMAGAKGESAKVRDAVRFDPAVKNYVQSFQASGASADQVQGVVNAAETLALAKRNAGEAGDAGSAASAAVKSFFGRFDYIGNARVPSKVMDAVSANARATLDGLSLDHVAVPERFGQPGQPEPREYLDTIKAAPTWITSQKGDALLLMDYGGRLVRGRDGQPISVPFSLPGPAPVVRAPPLAGVSVLPAAVPPQPAGAPVSPAAAAAARDAAANPSANVVPGL